MIEKKDAFSVCHSCVCLARAEFFNSQGNMRWCTANAGMPRKERGSINIHAD